MSQKVMKLIDPSTGLMECKVCGARHNASLQSGHNRKDGVTRYYRGSWQCVNKCKMPVTSGSLQKSLNIIKKKNKDMILSIKQEIQV